MNVQMIYSKLTFCKLCNREFLKNTNKFAEQAQTKVIADQWTQLWRIRNNEWKKNKMAAEHEKQMDKKTVRHTNVNVTPSASAALCNNIEQVFSVATEVETLWPEKKKFNQNVRENKKRNHDQKSEQKTTLTPSIDEVSKIRIIRTQRGGLTNSNHQVLNGKKPVDIGDHVERSDSIRYRNNQIG